MSLPNTIHLRDGEEVVITVRRSLLTHAWRYAISFFVLFCASFLMFWLFGRGWWGTALFALSVGAGLLFIFETWFFNHRNCLVVTNERIVDIHRAGWFDETMSSVGFMDIRDIALKRKGVLATVFNYGSVIIEPKSQKFILEFDCVKNPAQIQSLITQKIEFFRRDRRVATAEAVYNNFLKIIPDLTRAELNYAFNFINKQLDKSVEASKNETVLSADLQRH
jgi:hypothetical protein